MAEPGLELSSALNLIKRFITEWLYGGNTPDHKGLADLVDALDLVKEEAKKKQDKLSKQQQQRLSEKKASQMQPLRRQPLRTSQARRPSALFVAEDETDESDEIVQHQPEELPDFPMEPEDEQNHNPQSEQPSPDFAQNEQNPERTLDHVENHSEPSILPRSSHAEPVVATHTFDATRLDTCRVDDGDSEMSNAPDYFGDAFRFYSDTAENPYQSHHQSPVEQNMVTPTLEASGLEHSSENTADDSFLNQITAGDWGPRSLSQGFNEQAVITSPYEASDFGRLLDEIMIQNQDVAVSDVLHQDELQIRPQKFSENATVKNYIDIACRANLGLPHEPLEGADDVNVLGFLQPLVHEMPLTTALLHGLLYMLLPSTVHILEVHSSHDLEAFLSDQESATRFVAVVARPSHGSPILVLGDGTTSTFYILESDTVHLPIIEALRSKFAGWKEVYIDPHMVEPHIESTLLSVYIAEACFMHHLPITRVPDARHLRLRFLGELVAPYESNLLLAQCGLPANSALARKVDIRETTAQLTTPTQISTIEVANLENFDMNSLHKALLERPTEINRKRCLRILQCVNEIGSPHILDSLNLALAKEPQDRTSEPTEQRFVEKLFHIHLYLDNQESQSHLLVARTRYFKYYYYETYLNAVEALHVEKRNSKREKRKISAIKLTKSYQQGVCGSLPPTPHTDAIDHAFRDLDMVQKRKRAPDMIKDEISQRLAHHYRGDKKCIRKNITRYIKEGGALHCVLQDTVCLNPGLLVLFPGQEVHPPSLGLNNFNLELDQREQQSLRKPIRIEDVDGLTQMEARWFGKVLQARPALLDQVPENVMNLISNSLKERVYLGGRDPDTFRTRPLQFFMSD